MLKRQLEDSTTFTVSQTLVNKNEVGVIYKQLTIASP